MDTRILVTPTIAARFGTQPCVVFTHDDTEARIALKCASTSPVDGEAEALDVLSDPLIAALPEGWSSEWGIAGLRYPPPPEPSGGTPASHWARIDRLERMLRAVTSMGADLARSLPAGWVTPAEIAIPAIVDRLGREDGTATFVLHDVKEKFGTLRFYYRAEGSDRLLADLRTITDWLELSTHSRCMVTGHAGAWDDTTGWILTLSDEMRALRRRDPEAFSWRLYPPRPPRHPDGVET